MAGVLPQLGGDTFITDGGLETTLVFRKEMELPCFAAFPLLESAEGLELLHSYFDSYLALAADNGFGLLVDAPTRRASEDWGRQHRVLACRDRGRQPARRRVHRGGAIAGLR